ncbi:YHYH protein [Cellvibrio sp. OA-2007]|uniref:YHYH protein n=1 Tax=Cellvibrio sp. OA-2007 TaxID=529823 RepID=UPI000AE8C72A|nr:YHYH protein [Cellvibrio sp. OA-2007]
MSDIRGRDQPWFLWLAYSAPHSPFHLPPASLLKRTELTGTAEDIAAHHREYYLAMIEAMDTEIGRLLSAMSESQRANTMIIFIGDNGTPATVVDETVFSSSHAKNSLYEGGIRVPMIVAGKGVARSASREAALINTTDLFATIANVAGNPVSSINDSYNFSGLFTANNTATAPRTYNYSEFESAEVQGWTVRNQQYKYIQFLNGTQELYDLNADLGEKNNLLKTAGDYSQVVAALKAQGDLIRNTSPAAATDLTNKTLVNRSANCADYVATYRADARDVKNNKAFQGDLKISVAGEKCIFTTNEIPNHDFNDGTQKFANDVSAQNTVFEITSMPAFAASTTEISLLVDNAILLNGVKVDLLAAGCYNVGDGKVGCNNMAQPWRYDPLYAANGFVVDSHNAHAQPDGTYHYHGAPKTFYSEVAGEDESPLVGFAADGYPIYGPYINKNGVLRKAVPSYRLKSGARPSGNGNPGGTYNGQFRDDYEYVAGLGDLDECNGMLHNGVYGYYITDGFPYIVKCFKGTPDSSFNK